MSTESLELNPAERWRATAVELIAKVPLTSALESLAQLCLAGDEIMPECAVGPREGGLPPGRPPAPVVRLAARALITSTRQRTDRASRYLSTLGLVFAVWKATRTGSVAGIGEGDLSAVDARALAVEQARELQDDTLIAWAAYHLGLSERILGRWNDAVASLQLAADTAERVLYNDAAGHPGPFGAAPAPWADPLHVQQRVIASRAVKWISLTAPMLGDIELLQSSIDRLIPLSEPLREVRPSVAVEALTRQVFLAQQFGDRDTFRAVERTLEEWAQASGNNRVVRGWLAAAAGNAFHLHDLGRAAHLRQRQIDAAIVQCASAPAPGSPAPTYLAAVAELQAAGMRARLVSVGNSAFDIAFIMWRRGMAKTSPSAWNEANEWLNLAEAAWQPDGTNGVVAARLTRARLRVDGPPRADPMAAAAEALELETQALRAGLRSGAIAMAAQWCVPGDVRVKDRCNELLAKATHREQAKLLLARAVWHERFARQLEATGAAVEVTLPVWLSAQSDAIAAGDRLEVEGAFIDAERAAQAWIIGSTASSRIDATPDGQSRRLSYLLRATRCVAELQITASESARRAEVTVEYGDVVRSALRLAVELVDVHAADVILEALRRDRVGVMITDLARREDVGEAVRAAAERMMAANNAMAAIDEDGTTPPMVDESTMDFDDGDRALVDRGLALAARRDASLAEAHHILGVISVLADGRSLPTVSAADVLTARAATGPPTAILQLYPVRRTGSAESVGTRLVRRLTWWSNEVEIREHLDEVDLDVELVGLDPESPAQWLGSAALGHAVLPDPLRQLLEDSRRDRPLRLMIIPTDLFDIAFDALLLGDGSRLVERAAVSVHASLITMLHNAKHGRPVKVSSAMAMYDVRTLAHTKDELAALRRNIPTVETIEGRAELVASLDPHRTSTVDAFALAVHGLDDANGWGQTKRLPDGSLFTAAEALALSYPALCVLASCHSNVRVGADLELAGFPMALFARGALTVIGSLYAIDDRVTAEIMQGYWYHLAGGTDPVMALRLAKLDWLDAAKPPGSGHGRDLLAVDHSHHPRLWSGLVALGGAHL